MQERRDVESLQATNQELQEKISHLREQIESFEANASSENNSIMDKISNLEEQIAQKRKDITAIKDQLARRSEIYNRYMSPYSKNNELRQLFATTEAQLKAQRKQIAEIIEHLVQINNRQVSLSGYEWIEQRASVQAEISNLRREIQSTTRERESVEHRIETLQAERDAAIPIYNKWRGRVLSDTSDTFEHLMRELRKSYQPPEYMKNRLETEIKTNESMRQEIEKLRRETANKVKNVRKTITEMRKQTNKVYEQATLEEQIMIQRIIAMKPI